MDPSAPSAPGGYGPGYAALPPVTQQPQILPQTQPMNVTTTTVMINSPSRPGPRDWTSGVCSCCMDITSCLCTWFCGVCYLCHISKDMGEGCCMPCCIPPTSALAMLRVKLRTQQNIYGSLSDDYCMSCCCWPCVLCQLKRELDVIRTTEDSTRQLQG